jgi:hypothetical protein
MSVPSAVGEERFHASARLRGGGGGGRDQSVRIDANDSRPCLSDHDRGAIGLDQTSHPDDRRGANGPGRLDRSGQGRAKRRGGSRQPGGQVASARRSLRGLGVVGQLPRQAVELRIQVLGRSPQGLPGIVEARQAFAACRC